MFRTIFLCVLSLQLISGCAAQIIKSGVDEKTIVFDGVTESQLLARLGKPIRSSPVMPNLKAVEVWERDRAVSLFDGTQMVVSESVFKFKGRLDKDGRASQAGFDSFMTLGLAELYLIPKAIWERASGDDLQVSVWFNADGRALAYKWALLPKQ